MGTRQPFTNPQGVTVDRSFVYGSGSMDRHLTNVAMTRHREDVKFYASADEFKSPEMIGTKLSRARLQSTTLDYLERRDATPEQDRLAYVRQLYERQIERLKSVTERLGQIPAQLMQRFGVEVEAPDSDVSRPGTARTEASDQHRTRSETRPEGAFQAGAVGTAGHEERKPLIAAMTSDEAWLAKAELLDPQAIEKHVSNQSTVEGALNNLKRRSNFVSPEFEKEVSRLTAHEVENGAVAQLIKAHGIKGNKSSIVNAT